MSASESKEAESDLPNTSSQPTWPELDSNSPLQKLIDQHTAVIEHVDYDEIYGIHLNKCTSFQRNIILQKFLRANANDIEKALAQLTETLQWRKSFEPLKAMDETFSAARFGGLGYVTTISNVPGSRNKQDVVTFNIYGAVKDNKLT